MNKTITIHLQNIPFIIDETAHTILQHYMDDIAKHFAQSPDQPDIIADIERSIAEKWSAKNHSTTTVITVQDVTTVISVLGSIESFESDDSTDVPLPKPVQALHRNLNNAMLGGVASGVADYFSINPATMRLVWLIVASGIFTFVATATMNDIEPHFIFFVLSLNGLCAVLLYIILWCVLPTGKTTSVPVTAHTLISQVKTVFQEGLNKR